MAWTEGLGGQAPLPEDAPRIAAVLAALDRLRPQDPTPWAQGLTAPMARHCLDLCLDAITAEGLAASLPPSADRARQLTLVAAHGVFTSPFEWVALALAGGARVRLKAPSRDPTACAALVDALQAEGLPVELRTARELGRPDALLAFGADASVAAIQQPGARITRYGHRFSLALAGPATDPAALALDVARYDGRGCLAPVAILTAGDPRALVEALAQELAALEPLLPRGAVDPALGPPWRRRLGLARALGLAHEGPAWAALQLPAQRFVPLALPRMATVHSVEDPAALTALLAPWRPALSSISHDPDLAPAWQAALAVIPRRCPTGYLQAPPMPRLHDGLPLGHGLLGP